LRCQEADERGLRARNLREEKRKGQVEGIRGQRAAEDKGPPQPVIARRE